jgi:hypothetical protein
MPAIEPRQPSPTRQGRDDDSTAPGQEALPCCRRMKSSFASRPGSGLERPLWSFPALDRLPRSRHCLKAEPLALMQDDKFYSARQVGNIRIERLSAGTVPVHEIARA